MKDISHDVVMTDIFRKDPAYAAALPAGKGGESREAKLLWEVSPHLQTARIAGNDGKPIDWQKNKTISAQSLFSRSCPKATKISRIL